MASEIIFKRMMQNGTRAEELVQFIKQALPSLKKAMAEKQQEKMASEIKEENSRLKRELQFWKNRVTELEIANGITQYTLPSIATGMSCNFEEVRTAWKDMGTEKSIATPTTTQPEKKTDPGKVGKKVKDLSTVDKVAKKTKDGKSVSQQIQEENNAVDVSRLDLRIGCILNAKKHPDAESLYVEEIDVGEAKPRTVVSGLVKFVPLEEMQRRMVVVLCNLKPAKMRGITSEAMVMCASTPEKVEILSPPAESVPGDRVVCEEFPGKPDLLLNPKKKILEQVLPDLKTDNACNATYKSNPLLVAGKGVVKSATLTNVQIK